MVVFGCFFPLLNFAHRVLFKKALLGCILEGLIIPRVCLVWFLDPPPPFSATSRERLGFTGTPSGSGKAVFCRLSAEGLEETFTRCCWQVKWFFFIPLALLSKTLLVKVGPCVDFLLGWNKIKARFSLFDRLKRSPGFQI